MRPKLLFFVSVFRNLTLKCKKNFKSKRNRFAFPYFRHKILEKIVSLKVCDTWLNLSLFKADKSQRSSIVSAILLLNKELYA